MHREEVDVRQLNDAQLEQNNDKSIDNKTDHIESKRNFDVIADKLLDEAPQYAAEFSDNPDKALDLLIILQSIAPNLQEAPGRHVRIHIILEACRPGYNPSPKFRHVFPIFSRILIPAFRVDIYGSAIVVTSLIEALAIADKVVKADQNWHIPLLDYHAARSVEFSLPFWYPGDGRSITSNDEPEFFTLSSYCRFDYYHEAKQSAASELSEIYLS